MNLVLISLFFVVTLSLTICNGVNVKLMLFFVSEDSPECPPVRHLKSYIAPDESIAARGDNMD